jgi:branched-subunit amino acid permease
MGVFTRKPLHESKLQRLFAKHPTWFGIPFVLIILGASFGMELLMKVRYEMRDKKVKQVGDCIAAFVFIHLFFVCSFVLNLFRPPCGMSKLETNSLSILNVADERRTTRDR